MIATASARDIESPYSLTDEQIAYFREMGFIKLKNVFSPETLEHYGSRSTKLILEFDPRRGQPISQRDTHVKAFIQVGTFGSKVTSSKSLSSASAPTLDVKISPAEWDDAASTVS